MTNFTYLMPSFRGIFSIIIFLLCQISPSSQELSDYDLTLSYLEQLAESDSSLVKDLERYKYFNSNKIDANHSLDGYYSAVAQTMASSSCTDDLAQWGLIGPDVYVHNNVPYNGYISAVIGDSDDEDFRLMGTENSGIWIWNPSISEWINATDNLEVPGLGIKDIIVNPCNPNHIIAATGTSFPNVSVGVGIIESFNKGAVGSWTINSSVNPSMLPVSYSIDALRVNHPKSNCVTNEFFYYAVKEGIPGSVCERREILDLKYDGAYTINTINLPICISCDPTCDWFHKSIYDIEVISSNSFVVSSFSHYSYNGHIQIYNGTWSAPIPFIGIPPDQKPALSNIENNIGYVAMNHSGNIRTIYKLNVLTSSLTYVTTVQTTASASELFYSDVSNLLYLGLANFQVFTILDLSDTSKRKTFTDANLHADVRDIFLFEKNSTSEKLYVATDGGVAEINVDVNNIDVSTVTDLSGLSMPTNQFFNISVAQSNQDKYLASGMHQGVFNNGIGVSNWHLIRVGDGVCTLINPFDESIFYYQGNYKLYSTEPLFNNALTTGWHLRQKLKVDPNNSNIIYWTRGNQSSGSPGYLSVYDNNLSAWFKHIQTSHIEQLGAIDIADNNGAIYVANASPGNEFIVKLEKKTSLHIGNFQPADLGILTINGKAKTLREHLAYNKINDIAIDPENSNIIYLAISGVVTHWSTANLAIPEEFRVIKSYDAGNTWIDVSKGLDATPCNELLFQIGTDGRIFVSNEFGVFYRDNSFSDTDDWLCFHSGLPARVITGLEINYCKNELVASTFGNAAWKTDLSMLPTLAKPREITTNTTWNTMNKVIYSDVIVKAGITLSITNSNIKLAEDVRIIVEPSATLRTNNSNLTSLCEGTCWDGITVEGNSHMPQTSFGGAQGRALISGGSISNARSALNLAGYDEINDQYDWNQMGGMAHVMNCTFKENRRSISVMPFDNIDGTNPEQPNLSVFQDCNFIIDDNYSMACGSNEAFITIFGADGIQINGCSFIDSRTSLSDPSEYRRGIFSLESTFIVQPSPSSLNNCTFTNLSQGIRAEKLQHDNNFEIQILEAEFINNQTSIAFYDINNESRILGNYALIGHQTGFDSYGIVLHSSSGFQVEENICKKDDVHFSGWTHGYDIADTYNANNDGTTAPFGYNVIKNNISKGNNVGFKAWGNNLLGLHKGLEFLCNQNIGNTNSDFWILDPIKLFQGSGPNPAGNTFTCGGVPPFDIDFNSCFTYIQENSPPCLFDPCINLLSTTNSSDCNYITNTTSLDEKSTTFEGLSLYPNPVNESLTVKFESALMSTLAKIDITNNQGLNVKSITINRVESGMNEIFINTQDLPNGLFFVSLKIEDVIATNKFIKMTK